MKRWTVSRAAFGLALGLLGPLLAFGQDPQFTQFYANPLYLNPAFAGTARCPRVVLNYRNQWPALSGTFVTTSASYDQDVRGIMGGLGLLVTNDQAGKGTLTTTTASGIYSYTQAINRKFSIKVGFQATYFQKSLDWNKLTFGDMIDPQPGLHLPDERCTARRRCQRCRFLGRCVGLHGHLLRGLRCAPPHRTQ